MFNIVYENIRVCTNYVPIAGRTKLCGFLHH